MHDSLLVRLRSYRPREGRDSLENFITEAFCWFLRHSEGFASRFLQLVNNTLQGQSQFELPSTAVDWDTQQSMSDRRPDMVASWRGVRLIFEHKVGAAFSENQLADYRRLAHQFYPKQEIRIIAITENTGQHEDNADACLCWHEVYTLLDTYLEQCDDASEVMLLRQFQKLLAYEGLAPANPVDFQAIRYYPVAGGLPMQLEAVFAPLARRAWPLSGYDCSFSKMRWGRLGLDFIRLGEGAIPWSPGIFIGCVLDGSDHGVSHRLRKEIKLQVILSFDHVLHAHYPEMASYSDLKDALRRSADESGWTFYNHLDEERSPNRYHPLYLEASLFDIMRGALTADAQRERIFESAAGALELIRGSEHFDLLVEECRRAVKK